MGTTGSGFRGLQVWQRAMDLVVASYHVAHKLPSHEQYALTSQLRRAAVSIPANIAEGDGRVHRGDYIYHLSVARGSLMELETHVEIACRLKYVREEELADIRKLMDHASRMLHRLTIRLKP